MNKPIYYRFFIFSILLFFALNIFAQHPKREMRAAWIASVSNIDWPSSSNLTCEQQRSELISILNGLASNNLNAVVVQIRPTADALYNSYYEPWSHWLTGKQGNHPNPYYDPLEFIIDEAHKRFMDVHVWINPYRVTTSEKNELSPKHLFFKNRDLFIKYGNKYYFDPGLDETREFLNLLVRDIVGRYDIDAVHMDDYFYPYPEKGLEFPDQATFEKYPRGFASGQKDAWRRNNVDMIIAELQTTIKSVKPWVEFGISPFGVWRNGDVDPRGSATNAGIQNYDDLHADILKWLEEGTIDYVAPQLYWEIGKRAADYSILVEWWSRHSFGKNLYIGLAVYKLGEKPNVRENSSRAWTKGNELTRQIRKNREHPEVDGAMFFSTKNFLANRQGLNDSLKTNYYKYPAICPTNRNIIGTFATQPENVRIIKDDETAFLFWDKINKQGGERIAYYVVYAFKGKQAGDLNNPENILARTQDNFLELKDANGKKLDGHYTFVVTAINRYKYESIPTYAVTRKL